MPHPIAYMGLLTSDIPQIDPSQFTIYSYMCIGPPWVNKFLSSVTNYFVYLYCVMNLYFII